MTSKEDLIELKDAFLTIKQEWLEDSNVKLTEWQEKTFNNAIKDLEILEEIRNDFKIIDWGEDFQNRYELIYQNWYRVFINKEQYDKWSRWLERSDK